MGRPQDSGTRPTGYGNYGGRNHYKHNRALKEVEEGRQKAEPEAAQLRVEVEELRRRGGDLQRRLGVAKAQVRSLTSTLSATTPPSRGRVHQGCRVRVAGAGVGVNAY